MFNNIKLAGKIALGFGTLILISMVLGGIAVVNMLSVKKDSGMLAHEYAPEVKVATDLRGAANRLMYEMRGYGFTENHAYYEAAQTELGAVEKHLQEAHDLEQKSENLKKLKGQIEIAENTKNKYQSLVEKTLEITGKLAEERKDLDDAARRYMDNCNAFLASQNEASLLRKLMNNRAYISKNRNAPDKQKKVQERIAENQKIEKLLKQ